MAFWGQINLPALSTLPKPIHGLDTAILAWWLNCPF